MRCQAHCTLQPTSTVPDIFSIHSVNMEAGDRHQEHAVVWLARYTYLSAKVGASKRPDMLEQMQCGLPTFAR
jgi:hypothetical protein